MRWVERVIEAHKQHLSERPPDRRGELIARWERWRSGGGPDPAVEKSLELVADGSRNEEELGFYVLMDLAATDPSLRNHVRQLTSHRSASVRRGLAFYLSGELPAEFQEVYASLLRDKAASVRRKTIDTIGIRSLKELLPELRSLRSDERDDKVTRRLEYWIPLLELGYRVTPRPPPGWFEVTVLTGKGIAGRGVRATDADDPAILRAIEELRRQR